MCASVRENLLAESGTFGLKAVLWFRSGRLFMVSPDSQAVACPLSGRNSTYRPVQISGAGSEIAPLCIEAPPVQRGSSAPDAGDRSGRGTAFCFVSEPAPAGARPVHYRFGG